MTPAGLFIANSFFISRSRARCGVEVKQRYPLSDASAIARAKHAAGCDAAAEDHARRDR
jgi:hypothetical protein